MAQGGEYAGLNAGELGWCWVIRGPFNSTHRTVKKMLLSGDMLHEVFIKIDIN